MHVEPLHQREALEGRIPSIKMSTSLITLIMSVAIIGIAGCGRSDGERHAQADCPARPADTQINALMENTIRPQYLDGSPYDVGFVHWKVDYLTEGQNCQTYIVYLTQYWPAGQGPKYHIPDDTAQLIYATDGRWRLQFKDKSYQVN